MTLAPTPKLLLLDRDGTLNADNGYIAHPSQLVVLPEAIEGLNLLQGLGYRFVIVTNQGGIALGHYTLEDMHRVNRALTDSFKREGIHFEKIYYCPHNVRGTHREFGVSCACRKPEPGMLLDALRDFPTPKHWVWMIGDKVTDVEAGVSAGVNTVFLGNHRKEDLPSETIHCKNLLEFARWRIKDGTDSN